MATRRPLTDRQREILQAERSHKRMSARQVESARQQEVIRTAELTERARSRASVRLQSEKVVAGQQRNRRIVGDVAGAAVSPVTQGPAKANIALVIIFTMAALIVFYDLVAHPTATPAFLTGVGNWLHTFSTTTPLFTKSIPPTTGSTTGQPASAKGTASTTTGQVLIT